MSKTRKKPWRLFEEARLYARSLGLKSRQEWLDFVRGKRPDLGKRPDDIPMRPLAVYIRLGWCGYKDWLGLETERWRSFADARKFVRRLGLQTIDEWRLYRKGEFRDTLGVKPENIPAAPDVVYQEKGWTNWGDFLGTENIANYNKKYRPFKEAQKFARSLNLKKNMEWRKYCKDGLKGKPKKPDDIPATPNGTYRNKGWISWVNFLGTGNVAARKRIRRSFEDARKFVRSLKLKSSMEWRDYVAGRLPDKPPLPADIPSNPDSFYKDKGWISWSDWIGTPRARKKSRQ